MKKKSLLLSIVLKILQTTLPILLQVFQVTIYAQSVTPSVISTSGGFHTNDSGMLSFTIGEMSAIETYISPSIILTQGFQQSWDLGTYVIEDLDHPFSFGLYPNLSNGIFNLVVNSDLNAYVDVRILDIVGKEIFNTSIYHDRGMTMETIDISNSAEGMYFVILSVKEKKNSAAHHFIEKIQIIK